MVVLKAELTADMMVALMIMMMFSYIKLQREGSQNLHSLRFHINQPKMHKYNNISMIIRNKGSINDNEAETIPDGLVGLLVG
jgi:hypothetical protein